MDSPYGKVAAELDLLRNLRVYVRHQYYLLNVMLVLRSRGRTLEV